MDNIKFDSKIAGIMPKIKYLTWNVGHWAKGNATSSTVTDEDYDEKRKAFKKIFNYFEADIVGLCEFSSIFYPNGRVSAYNAILSCYAHKYIAPTESGYIGTAFFSNTPISDLHEIELSDGYRAYYGTIYINGLDVIVCEAHLPWYSLNLNKNDISTIISSLSQYERVIVAGDINILNGYEEEEIALWTAANYVPANWGYLGKILTSYNNNVASNYLDNIFVKGGRILKTEVLQNTPDGADADTPSSATEEEWDEVNLSDHFPMVCTIDFSEQ